LTLFLEHTLGKAHALVVGSIQTSQKAHLF
jgi:hypothetical protein